MGKLSAFSRGSTDRGALIEIQYVGVDATLLNVPPKDRARVVATINNAEEAIGLLRGMKRFYVRATKCTCGKCMVCRATLLIQRMDCDG